MEDGSTIVPGMRPFNDAIPVPGIGQIVRLRVENETVFASRSDGAEVVEWQAVKGGWTHVPAKHAEVAAQPGAMA